MRCLAPAQRLTSLSHRLTLQPHKIVDSHYYFAWYPERFDQILAGRPGLHKIPDQQPALYVSTTANGRRHQ